jgi:hypothetical protein
LSHEQALDLAPARVTAADQARREHTGVVQHQQIACAQVPPQVREHRMLDRRSAAGQDEQAGASALRGLLRDQLVRQIEVEVGNVH